MTSNACSLAPGRMVVWEGFRVHKFLGVVLIFFFFNTVGLPKGILFTSVLAPYFYLWLIKHNVRLVATKFLAVLSPFVVAHLVLGVDYRYYLTSFLVLFSVYLSGYAIYRGLPMVRDPGRFLLLAIRLNFAASLVALVVKATPLAALLWGKNVISANMDEVMRLKMLMYEPSHYSSVIVPLVLFAYFRCLLRFSVRNLGVLLMVLFPLGLSYSFGNISAVLIAIGVITVVYLRPICRLNRAYLFAIPLAALLVAAVLLSGSFAQRLANIVTGNDTSGQARTVLSYLLSYQIASVKSLWWGVGLGQVKVIAPDIIAVINKFWAENDAHLPCVIAETMATFGIFGLSLRLLAEIFLFFRTRVYRNYYRLSLFIFMFVYQFTGSYTTNIIEYAIWIVAFSPLFPEFEVKRSPKPRPRRRLSPAVPAAGAGEGAAP